MHPITSIISCLCGSDADDYHPLSHPATSATPLLLTHEHKPRPPTQHLTPAMKKAVADVLAILRTADASPYLSKAQLAQQVDDAVYTQGSWSEWIAEGILNGIRAILEQGPEKMGSAMRIAHDRAAEAAGAVFQFASDHPEVVAGLLTIVAIGVLVLLAPMVVEALGFAELGPIEGSFAAWWESTYAGYIPRGSLFSFFQRLGMVWAKA